jgi:hypothetical protein
MQLKQVYYSKIINKRLNIVTIEEEHKQKIVRFTLKILSTDVAWV